MEKAQGGNWGLVGLSGELLLLLWKQVKRWEKEPS